MTEAVGTRDEFVAFLESLRCDLAERPAGWSNQDLAAFLEAMKCWTEDMDGYYRNLGQAVPTEPSWQMFADILNGARVYE